MPTDPHPPTFGERLRWHRKAAGLTQAELANAAQVSERAISDLERGINLAPNKSTLDLLIKAPALEGPARARYEESLASQHARRDRHGLARTLNNLGILAWEQRDYARARARYEESLALHQELGARLEISNLLGNLGIVAADQGDYAAARAYYEQSLALSSELGDRLGTAACLASLGVLALEQRDYTTARAHLERSLALHRVLDNRPNVVADLHNLALVDLAQGERAPARRHECEALTLLRDLGLQTLTIYVLVGAAGANSAAAPAARLLGASAWLGETNHIQLSPAEQRLYDQSLDLTQAALGATGFARAFAAGQALAGEEALDEAITALETMTKSSS